MAAPAQAELFEHAPTQTVVRLRASAPNDRLPPVILMGQLRILEERGVISEAARREWLHEVEGQSVF